MLQVFAVNGDVRNDEERAANLQADLDDLASERDVNERGRDPTAAIDRSRFGGAADPRTGCNNWVSSKAASRPRPTAST